MFFPSQPEHTAANQLAFQLSPAVGPARAAGTSHPSPWERSRTSATTNGWGSIARKNKTQATKHNKTNVFECFGQSPTKQVFFAFLQRQGAPSLSDVSKSISCHLHSGICSWLPPWVCQVKPSSDLVQNPEANAANLPKE